MIVAIFFGEKISINSSKSRGGGIMAIDIFSENSIDSVTKAFPNTPSKTLH